MILTAHQSQGIGGYLGLYHKIALADEYIYMDTVKYTKQDFINRNKIKTPQGYLWLTIPVLTNGSDNIMINEIKIDNNQKWKEKHWKSIKNFYQKAPYFNLYAEFFEYLYSRKWEYLSDFNYYLLNYVLWKLKINTKVYKMSEYNFQGKKSDLVLDMCKQIKADLYIFGKMGVDYADVNSFKDNNIEIYFQDYNHPKYNQQYGEFESYMSVIDLLFNEGNNSLNIIMSNNITKNELKENDIANYI
jgi:hypothetical protein